METRNLLLDTAERMFTDHCDKSVLDDAERGQFPDKLWTLLREGGFQQLAMADSGVALGDAMAVLKAAGRAALPLPLAEIILANRWLGNDGKFVSVGLARPGGARDVPWARRAEAVISVSASGGAWLLTELTVQAGVNLAGEPRDAVAAGRSEPLEIGEDACLLLALSRALLMAGGLEKVLALSLTYVTEREQFGRPIAKFQAIQHHLAVMAAEVAAATRAADAALDGLDSDRPVEEVAAAAIRIGEAVGVVVELAHQVHGAMGFTHEHQLHHSTRRLWSWRDEYGNEHFWQKRLGTRLAELVAQDGQQALWAFIASRG